jgi:cell shape-determining protein MreD
MNTIFADQLYFIIAGIALLALSFIIFIIILIVKAFRNQRRIQLIEMNQGLLEIGV